MKIGNEIKSENMNEINERIICLAIHNTHEVLFSGLSSGNISIWSLNENN